MAVTSVASGTQTAVISTEHTLTTQTSAGVYVLVVDTYNMSVGDTLVLKIYTKAKSGGSSRQAFVATFSNVQVDLIKYSPPVPADVEIKCTLTQINGTARDFDWSLLKL